MEVEIEFVDKSKKWVLNQPFIRIGRGAKCEVALAARQFPQVATEHVVLDVFSESVRVGGASGASGEILINGRPAAEGDFLRPGDILRLGSSGPEMSIRFGERTDRSVASGHAPTQFIRSGGGPEHEPTRVVSIPIAASDLEKRNSPPANRTTVYQAGGASLSGAGSQNAYDPPASSTRAVGSLPVNRNDRGQESSQPKSGRETFAETPRSNDDPGLGRNDLRGLESKLKFMQITQITSLLLLVLMMAWVFQLNRKLSETQDQVVALRQQASSAVTQFTPALDAKLSVFENQMDGLDAKLKGTEAAMETDMDAKMKQAQEQMFAAMDVKMKATEDGMVNRMNTEIPVMLDKYINGRLGEIKH